MTHKKETANVGPEAKPYDALKSIQENIAPKRVPRSFGDKRKFATDKTFPAEKISRQTRGGSISPNGRSGTSEESYNLDKNTNNHDMASAAAIDSGVGTYIGKNKSQDSANSKMRRHEKTKVERDVVALNLHIDTSPIHFEFSTSRVRFVLYNNIF